MILYERNNTHLAIVHVLRVQLRLNIHLNPEEDLSVRLEKTT